MPNKPYAESCEQNKWPILEVLGRHAKGRQSVLEIGSGTGQHAVFFAAELPCLCWQTSDLEENHAGIEAWINASSLHNVLAPLTLNVVADWPRLQYDLLFSANTLHIMSAQEVEQLMRKSAQCMHEQSVLLVYGPFNYHNNYTSESNARFDVWLKQRDPASGIKNFGWLQGIATQCGLSCTEDIAMPSNNRILVWRKGGA